MLTTGQKNTAPGPQIRVYTNFYDDECDPSAAWWAKQRAIIFELDSQIITRDQYAALNAEQQATASCINDFTLPLGFQPGDDLNSIDLFGEPHWGEEAEVGYSLRPEQDYNIVNVGLDQDLTPNLTLHANVRYAMKDSSAERGLPQVGGTLHANNPYNPFGTAVSLVGLAADQPPQYFESETEELFARLGMEGTLGTWQWQAEFNNSRSELASTQFNTRDPAYGLGINSDGVTDAIIGRFSGIDEAACADKLAELGGTRYSYSSFFGGNCTVYGAPPDPINPFGDISPWIIAGLDAGSTNKQTQFEALVRGNLLELPGGPIALVAGYDFREDALESFSEFSGGAYLGFSTPARTSVFDTSTSRDNSAAFIEGLVPLIGAGNAMASVQRLNLTFSGRYDSYSNVEVDYRQTATDRSGAEELADPGSEFTWSAGVVYQPVDTVRLKARMSTAFVAPQLNQLLQRAQLPPVNDSFLWYLREDGALGFLDVSTYRGGNDQLTPETADILSFTAEFSPTFLPGIFFKASWSDTEFVDRIVKLSRPGILESLDNLPSNVYYVEELDLYVLDDRWINVAAVKRTGMDYELRYEWEMGLNEFSILVRRGYTNRYEAQEDVSAGIVHSLVTTRDNTGEARSVLPPVPKHQTSAQFMWMRGGLFFSLDVQGADMTQRLETSTRTEITEPSTNYDLVLGYEFGADTLFDAPAWMDGLDASLTINNLTNAFARNSVDNPETGERRVFQINPFYEWTQGRSYRLNIHMSF